MRTFLMVFLLFFSFLIAGCGVGGMKSEKEVCEEDAMKEYLGCLFNYVYIQQNLFHADIQAQPEETNFAIQVCSFQYLDKMKCADQSNFRPTRGD